MREVGVENTNNKTWMNEERSNYSTQSSCMQPTKDARQRASMENEGTNAIREKNFIGASTGQMMGACESRATAAGDKATSARGDHG